MKLWKSLLCLLLCAVMLGGCGGEPEPAAAAIPLPDDGYFDIGVDDLPYSEEELYSQLFDLNNKITIQIDMPDAELQKLQDDYYHYNSFGSKSPIYRMGTLVLTIQTAAGPVPYRMQEVGVRMKGNTSRTDFYNETDGIYKYIHLKLDFQETFDDEDDYGTDARIWDDEDLRDARKDRTFAGLESLEMRWNKCYDQTYLKETYAYTLYRAEGVMAPLTNLCSFDWSGTHMGIYTIVEPVDKLFLEKRLPEEEQGGDLYKCGWPASFTSPDSIGVENENKGEFYVYDLKTNKKTSDHAALKNWLAQLNYSTMTKEHLADLVDMVPQFLQRICINQRRAPGMYILLKLRPMILFILLILIIPIIKTFLSHGFPELKYLLCQHLVQQVPCTEAFIMQSPQPPLTLYALLAMVL